MKIIKSLMLFALVAFSVQADIVCENQSRGVRVEIDNNKSVKIFEGGSEISLRSSSVSQKNVFASFSNYKYRAFSLHIDGSRSRLRFIPASSIRDSITVNCSNQ